MPIAPDGAVGESGERLLLDAQERKCSYGTGERHER